MTDPTFPLRAGQAGPMVTGTPGNVLAFGANGERIGGVPGSPAGGCVSNGAVITGAFACAENNNCSATADSASATGDGTTASGFASCSANWNTQASGAAAFACNFDTAATRELSFACGSQSATVEQADFAHAAGQFATRGDGQFRMNEYRGQTFGQVAGQSCLLKIGNNDNICESGKCYYVVVTCLVVKMGVGGGTKQSGSFERRFLMNVDSGGTPHFSGVQEGPDLVIGAVCVGATLVPSAGDFSNVWKLTFTLDAGVQAAVNALAHIEFVEVLGD